MVCPSSGSVSSSSQLLKALEAVAQLARSTHGVPGNEAVQALFDLSHPVSSVISTSHAGKRRPSQGPLPMLLGIHSSAEVVGYQSSKGSSKGLSSCKLKCQPVADRLVQLRGR